MAGVLGSGSNGWSRERIPICWACIHLVHHFHLFRRMGTYKLIRHILVHSTFFPEQSVFDTYLDFGDTGLGNTLEFSFGTISEYSFDDNLVTQ